MSHTTLNGNSESIFSLDNSWDQLLLSSFTGVCAVREHLLFLWPGMLVAKSSDRRASDVESVPLPWPWTLGGAKQSHQALRLQCLFLHTDLECIEALSLSPSKQSHGSVLLSLFSLPGWHRECPWARGSVVLPMKTRVSTRLSRAQILATEKDTFLLQIEALKLHTEKCFQEFSPEDQVPRDVTEKCLWHPAHSRELFWRPTALIGMLKSGEILH